MAWARVEPSEECDKTFFYYLLRYLKPNFIGIARNKQTTGLGHVTRRDLETIEVAIPQLSEQRTIASVLGALDDKIELNRRMNETQHAVTQALFEKTVSNRGAMNAGKFEQLATLSRETINPSEFRDETFDHYSIPAFDEERWPKAETGEQIKSNKFLVPANSVMISKLNPRIPRIWMPSVSNKSRSVASTEFLVTIPKPGISREWLYGLFTSQQFLDVFTTLVTGTSGSHQRVKPEYLRAMEVEVPSNEAIERYTKAVAPLHERIALNLKESRTLAALRDALLPRLLSGELRISVPI